MEDSKTLCKNKGWNFHAGTYKKGFFLLLLLKVQKITSFTEMKRESQLTKKILF